MKLSHRPPVRPTVSPDLLRELSRPDPAPSIARFVGLWVVLALAVLACGLWPTPATFVAAAFVLGWAQHALAVLGHEGAHGNLLPNRRWNDRIAGWLCWAPIGFSMEGYKRMHFPHHRDPGGRDDPEHDAFPEWPYRRRFRRWLPWASAASSLVGGAVAELIGVILYCRPRGRRELLPIVATCVVAPAVCFAVGLWWIPCLWFGSLFTTFFVFSRLRAFAEHTGIKGTHRVAVPGWLRWASHPFNVDHHWEHHHFPSVPCSRLPELRAAVGGVPVEPLGEMWGRLERSARTS